MTHIVPINDLKEHIEDSKCFCRPRYKGGGTFVHNSCDGREHLERAIYAETTEESVDHFAAYANHIYFYQHTYDPVINANERIKAAFARLFFAWQAKEFTVTIESPNADA
jgi:hypothetical protein